MALPVIHLDRATGQAFIGWSGEVNTFADLPPFGDHVGEFYMVLQPTGSRFLFTYKASGLYRSEGGAWVKKNNIQLLLNDDQFSIYNALDNSKVISFDVSGVSTATQRTYAWQDKDGTVALLGDVATLNPLIFNQVVNAPALTVNTHDFVIPGLKDNNVLNVSTDGGNYDLTGIVPTGIVNGQTFFVYNVGDPGIVKLKNASIQSLPANRFITDGDVQIKVGMGVIFTYDTSVSRWRVNYLK